MFDLILLEQTLNPLLSLIDNITLRRIESYEVNVNGCTIKAFDTTKLYSLYQRPSENR